MARPSDLPSTPHPDADCPAQARAIALLMDPATHGGHTVEHIETHVSHVFLAGDLAYKMKKAVRLDFVDFSTLARRKATCEREIEVNARTAPEIYLEVVAITEDDGRLELDGCGTPVEYLVKMRRFPQAGLLDRMANEGRLTIALMRDLADAIADLHLSAERVPRDRLAEDFGITATQLAERLAAAPSAPETAGLIATWRGLAEAELDARLPLIRARARHGGVRHGHGDLHLRNICLVDGRVRLFDAIEFEPKFSHIDILYDLAFAVMDLMHRDQGRLAIILLGRYLASTRDHRGIGVLRLFLSVRAAVRALVQLLGPDPDREAEARSYLGLAIDVLRNPVRPGIVAIGGRSGTGKSTVAQAVSDRIGQAPNVVILRSDEVRKHLFGVAAETRLDPAAYTAEITARTYRRMFRDARRVVQAGGTAILDATFLDGAVRRRVLETGAALGVPVHGIWLRADTALLSDRLSARRGDASDADAAVMRGQTEPADLSGWHAIDAGRALGEIAHDVMRVLGGD